MKVSVVIKNGAIQEIFHLPEAARAYCQAFVVLDRNGNWKETSANYWGYQGDPYYQSLYIITKEVN